jgi:Transaldolase/Fructose-6-phosphate aldolase
MVWPATPLPIWRLIVSENPLRQLYDYGQSFWFDSLNREMIVNGDLKRMIEDDGLRGTTSNPTIFHRHSPAVTCMTRLSPEKPVRVKAARKSSTSSLKKISERRVIYCVRYTMIVSGPMGSSVLRNLPISPTIPKPVSGMVIISGSLLIGLTCS